MYVPLTPSYNTVEGPSKQEKYADEVSIEDRTTWTARQYFEFYAITVLVLGGAVFLGMWLFTSLTFAAKVSGIIVGGYIAINALLLAVKCFSETKIKPCEVAQIERAGNVGLVVLSNPETYPLEEGVKGVFVEDHTKRKIVFAYSKLENRQVMIANGNDGMNEVTAYDQSRISIVDNTRFTIQFVSGHRDCIAVRQKVRKSDGTEAALPTLYVRVDKFFVERRPRHHQAHFYYAFYGLLHEGFAKDPQIRLTALMCASLHSKNKETMPTELGYNGSGIYVSSHMHYYMVSYEGIKIPSHGILHGTDEVKYPEGDRFVWINAGQASLEVRRLRIKVNEATKKLLLPVLNEIVMDYLVNPENFWAYLRPYSLGCLSWLPVPLDS